MPPTDEMSPTGWNVVEHDTPIGETYLNYDVFGGWWSDAEKSPSDTDDDNLCWAATIANIMEYTGWGYVGGMDTPDETLDYYGAHTTDQGTTIDYAFAWWFTGRIYMSRVVVGRRRMSMEGPGSGLGMIRAFTPMSMIPYRI